MESQRRYISATMPVLLHTTEDLLRFRDPGKTAELVRGVLVVREPPGTTHGARAARLTVRLGTFVEDHALGAVFAQDTGFKIATDPDTVRAPDVAFVARHRLDQITDEGYAELAPDLVAEILSPADRPGEGQVRVYGADGGVTVLGLNEILDGEDVLPGFRCPIRDVL